LLAHGVPDLAARVAFLGALGPVGQLPQAVRGRLWGAQLGWLPVRMGEGGIPGWGCLGGAWHWELSALPVPSRQAPASRLGGWAAGRPALQVAADWGQRVQPCIAYLVDELGVSDTWGGHLGGGGGGGPAGSQGKHRGTAGGCVAQGSMVPSACLQLRTPGCISAWQHQKQEARGSAGQCHSIDARVYGSATLLLKEMVLAHEDSSQAGTTHLLVDCCPHAG